MSHTLSTQWLLSDWRKPASFIHSHTSTHRHGTDQYQDTVLANQPIIAGTAPVWFHLLANQTAHKALPLLTAKTRNHKMADCPSYYQHSVCCNVECLDFSMQIRIEDRWGSCRDNHWKHYRNVSRTFVQGRCTGGFSLRDELLSWSTAWHH